MEHTKEDILQFLNRLLTPEMFDDYAPNGLQIEGKKRIKKIAFAVSATQESIKKAIEFKADALIVHHGVFWKHQGTRPITGAWGERIKLVIQNELNLFAYHLPLDAHLEIGNAASLGKLIGLENQKKFAEVKKQNLGIKGEFPTPLSAKDLVIKLKSILNHEVILATPDENALIRTMGIVTGGANNEWSEALKDGLDAYLTGEISEYNWHDSIEAGVHFFAGGHHATERFGIKALMEKMKNELKIETDFLDSSNLA
jgi:dinuclear metal center YbgI/SA1388 family protein